MTDVDRSDHPLRPLLLDATDAHRSRIITYDEEGNVHLCHPSIGGVVKIPSRQQYPCILPTFLALDKALSAASNSPRAGDGRTLRETFDAEYQAYLTALERRQGGDETALIPEPDYGTYVFDRRTADLYIVAPEYWHRRALITSNAKLLTDPAGRMTAEEIRLRLETAVVGFVGASLGSNLVEGVVREMRPRALKLADPDYLEATNLNRLQHGSIRYLTQPRGQRRDWRNPFETQYVNKAVFVAYENQLVDPYSQWYVYEEGLLRDNIDRFLLGDGHEPRLDYVVEEADDIRIKVEIRKRAREHGIPVFMATDAGHRAMLQFQDFGADQRAPIGYGVPDEVLMQRLEQLMTTGDRTDLFDFVEALIGPGFAVDEYADWMYQRGEQPTSSIPQSGSTAQLSGALGGKHIAMHRLGHTLRPRVVFDARRLELILD